MKIRRPALRLVSMLLLMIVTFVMSFSPASAAKSKKEKKENSDLPVYTEVELANPSPKPLLPLPGARDPNPTPYKANPDGFTYDKETGAPTGYLDSTISIRIETRVIDNTKVFFTWIRIADPSQLRTHASAKTNPISESQKIGALLAINGDWFAGVKNFGIIYRNGTLMRREKPIGNYDTLIIDDKGDFHILRRPEKEAFAAYEGHIFHSFLFGPGLVIDGKLMTNDKEIFERNKYGSGPGMGLGKKTQRQAICQMGKLSYLILTTEGPNDSKGGGFTAAQLAQVAYDVGAVNAYNLDAGSSACLFLGGQKVNRYGKGGVHQSSDLIYFITAEKPAAGNDSSKGK